MTIVISNVKHVYDIHTKQDYLFIACSQGYESSELIEKMRNGDYKLENGEEQLFEHGNSVHWIEATFKWHDSMLQTDAWQLAYELSS